MPAEVFYLQLLILCCLLKLGSTIFFLISLFFFTSTTAHKVPGVAAHTSLCTPQSYRHTQRGGVHQGASQEVPRAGHGDRVQCGAAWLQAPREAGLSTWDLWTRNGQGKAVAAPRGSKGRSSAMCWPSSSMGHISATPGPCSKPFVKIYGLQPWIFLPDLILDFRLQAAHRH